VRAEPVVAGLLASPSIISPAGPNAEAVARLWWVMLGAGTVVYLVTMVLLVVALRRRRERSPDRTWPGGRRLIAVFGVAMPVVVLVPLMFLTVATGRAMDRQDDEQAELLVEVTGYQFWWEVRYPDQDIVSANEIHVPVGRPVEFRLLSEDVIHSFWVPRLAGKLDMIPGRTNRYVFTAGEAGVYEGICAEFCGIQHARMHFRLVAHEPDDYQAWLDDRAEQRPPPAEGLAAEGREVFLTAGCASCHAVRGTSDARVGPDLTDLASRETLAAGLLDNNEGNLAGWILDPQSLKKGAGMPPSNLSGPELQALLAYLDTLR
jgi:cytochrome c oxidase subunit 2